jgi:hypothetical protein
MLGTLLRSFIWTTRAEAVIATSLSRDPFPPL